MINYISLFSGIGAYEKVMRNLGIKYNLIKYCEIHPATAKAYSVLHNVPESLNDPDVQTFNTNGLPPIDLITYSFPCQSLSSENRHSEQKGFVTESGKTKSGLFYDAARIIQELKPRVAIAENVPTLNTTYRELLNEIVLILDEIGYWTFPCTLNAKECGSAQDRNRVFIISIRKDQNFANAERPFILKRNPNLFKSILLERPELLDDFSTERVFSVNWRFLNMQRPQTDLWYDWLEKTDPKTPYVVFGGMRSQSAFREINYCPTLTTKGETIIGYGGRVCKRLQGYHKLRIMGFDAEDYDKLIQAGFSERQIIIWSGNSIDIHALTQIFFKIIDLLI